jgi:uncharacterized protein (DUF486 family)
MTAAWPWFSLAALGAWHGINPAMGWLFAVSRGLQEQRGSATAAALFPIALGHALAIGLALLVLAVGRISLDPTYLRWLTAAVLISFGIARLIRHRHFRWVGMRVGFPGLTWWSFLMATSHGAGLMLLPLFVAGAAQPACHAHAGLSLTSPGGYVGATLVHTGAMLIVTGVIALVVYYKLGLALLRHAWFNLEWLWSLALILAGATALIV